MLCGTLTGARIGRNQPPSAVGSRRRRPGSDFTPTADHPDTLASNQNLAVAYLLAGDRGRGIPLLEQTLADFTRVLGPDHPRTQHTRLNLEAIRR
jgi:hypothetical protein